MNVLFLSYHYDAPFTGPAYSIPGQIEAQSGIDNVFWYNLISESTVWRSLPYYHDLSDYPNGSVHDLPEPFSHPDIIVVEVGLSLSTTRIGIELMSGDIPYIVIPRDALAKQPQEYRSIPTEMLVAYSVLACNASAIQYLTEREYINSGDSWNDRHTIIPNVVPLPGKWKTVFHQDRIQCLFIGRISPYHKGLDLLVEACGQIRDELRRANCEIIICGPCEKEHMQEFMDLRDQVAALDLEDMVAFRKGVYGEEKERLILESDVFLTPSRFEGQPMSLLQALSYGLPCVATTGSTMREQVDAFHAGWTADNTSQSIAQALKRMIQEKDRLMEYSANARRLAAEYSPERIGQKQHEFYSEIANARSGSLN